MKYFKKEEDKVLLSKYLETTSDERTKSIIKYLISIFGDIELEESIIKEFIRSFSTFGGRYSVRCEEETLASILDFSETYDLSSKGISELIHYYIKDLFEEYSLEKVFQDFIDTYGKTDESFEKYIEFVDKIAEEYQERYKEEAKELDHLEDEYGKGFVDYLKSLVLRKHIHVSEIIKYLPEVELVKKDEKQLLDFSTRTRIYMSVCYPMSYKLIESMIKDKELSTYPEDFTYTASPTGVSIPLTFTKTEFIESIKKKQKIK